MDCPICNENKAHVKSIKHSPSLKGEELSVYSEANVCEKCDFIWTDDSQMTLLRQKAADEYKRIHSLLTSVELKQIRFSLGMSQEAFANYIGIGSASVKRYESYGIQDYSVDQLIRLRCDPDFALKNELLIAINRPANHLTGNIKFNWEKLKALILYFTGKAGSPLFLNKILFFVDFFHYKKCGFGITGSAYAKLDYGPCPDQQKAIFSKLKSENSIVEISKNKFIANEPFSLEIFSKDEQDTIRSIEKFVDEHGVEMVYKLSHDEKAYVDSSWYWEIDYELAKELKIALE